MPSTFTFRPARATPRVSSRAGHRRPDPHAIADTYRRQMAAAFVAAAATLAPEPTRLARGVGTANVDEAMASIRTHDFAPAIAAAFVPVVQRVMAAKGQWAMTNLVAPRVRVPLAKAEPGNPVEPTDALRFDLDNPYAITAAETMVGDLITNVSESTIDAVRTIISQSIVQGLPPARSSRLIANVVGLDNRRAGALAKYEAGLVSAGMSPARMDELLSSYHDRLLRDRAMTIARTETIDASVAGTLEGFRQAIANGFLDATVYGKVWLDTDDERTCPYCSNMAGEVVPFEQAFSDGSMGPTAHPDCFPSGTVVAGPAVEASAKRWYAGEMVEIVTADGVELSATPNHPILTDQGWVAAGLLHEGSRVVRSASPERVASCLDPDDQHGPTRIEDVAESFGRSDRVATVTVPTAREDFHGDGSGSQVHVVRTNRLLRGGFDAALAEPDGELALIGAAMHTEALQRQGLALEFSDRSMSATAGEVGGGDQSRARLGAGPGHAERQRGGAATDLDLCADQALADAVAIDPVGLGQSLLALTGSVTLDEVRAVHRQFTSGHVYNLDTTGGWYSANSIVVHNCRCDVGIDTLPFGAGASASTAAADLTAAEDAAAADDTGIA